MDIQAFGQTLKIKSKKTTLALDPKPSVTKFDADVILVTDKDYDASRINNYRLIIDGPGEYEISGLKVYGQSTGQGIIYSVLSENLNAIITKSSFLKGLSSDKIGEYQVVIINSDSEVEESKITAMEPNVVVLFGDRASESAKILGKENASISPKISVSSEKLPEETEIFVTG